MTTNEEVNLGIIGAVNISVLTLITLFRTIRFVSSCSYSELQTYVYRKKLVFHLFLLLASACDVPYYMGLVISGEFSLIPYSFHRFETAFLFAAFSITISDWGAVLYDINEFKLSAFLLRRATLISINAVYMLISLANFVACYLPNSNMDEYLKSPLYTASIFFQISVSFLLTCFMLSAGLKLSWRIRGAAGVEYSQHAYTRFTQRIRQVSISSVMYKPINEGSKEFLNALRNLNIVMGTCSCCILLQVIMLTLNYALGYATKSGKTVGPAYFYWAAYYWIPVWGMVLSLLYLARAHSPRRTFKSEYPRTSIPSNSNNPLISDGDGDIEGDLYDIDHDFLCSLNGDVTLSQALLEQGAQESETSSGNYLRGGFANNSYPPERTGSRDDDSVTSGITSDSHAAYALAERTQIQQQLSHSQQDQQHQQQSSSYIYSPDDSMSYRPSDATMTPMADMYSKGGLLTYYTEDSAIKDNGRLLSAEFSET